MAEMFYKWGTGAGADLPRVVDAHASTSSSRAARRWPTPRLGRRWPTSATPSRGWATSRSQSRDGGQPSLAPGAHGWPPVPIPGGPIPLFARSLRSLAKTWENDRASGFETDEIERGSTRLGRPLLGGSWMPRSRPLFPLAISASSVSPTSTSPTMSTPPTMSTSTLAASVRTAAKSCGWTRDDDPRSCCDRAKTTQTHRYTTTTA